MVKFEDSGDYEPTNIKPSWLLHGGEQKPEVMIKKEATFETKYTLLEELGKGTFGTVKKCKSNENGEYYAAKVVRKTAKSKAEVIREVTTMNQLQHKSIAQIHDAFETTKQMIIIMELINGKELFEKVVQEDNLLTETQCVYYLKQILSGVQYMHKKKIVHLDLKPENILCIDAPQGLDQIKLIDFGLARDLSANSQLSCICGTPEFVAPEVINFDPISVQSDMWSLGVIIYVLMSGISPFLGDDDGETLQNVTAGEFDFEDDDGTFDSISEEAKEFISDLICLDPRDRLTVEDCLTHPWLLSKPHNGQIDTSNLKKFIARRRWLRTIHAIKAVGRFTASLSMFGGAKKPSLAATMLAALKNSNENKSQESDESTALKPINGVKINQSHSSSTNKNQSSHSVENIDISKPTVEKDNDQSESLVVQLEQSEKPLVEMNQPEDQESDESTALKPINEVKMNQSHSLSTNKNQSSHSVENIDISKSTIEKDNDQSEPPVVQLEQSEKPLVEMNQPEDQESDESTALKPINEVKMNQSHSLSTNKNQSSHSVENIDISKPTIEKDNNQSEPPVVQLEQSEDQSIVRSQSETPVVKHDLPEKPSVKRDPSETPIAKNGQSETASVFPDDDGISDELRKRAEKRRRRRNEEEDKEFDIFANIGETDSNNNNIVEAADDDENSDISSDIKYKIADETLDKNADIKVPLNKKEESDTEDGYKMTDTNNDVTELNDEPVTEMITREEEQTELPSKEISEQINQCKKEPVSKIEETETESKASSQKISQSLEESISEQTAVSIDTDKVPNKNASDIHNKPTNNHLPQESEVDVPHEFANNEDQPKQTKSPPSVSPKPTRTPPKVMSKPKSSLKTPPPVAPKSPVPDRKSRRERGNELQSPSPPSKSPVPERKSRRERNIDLRSPSPPSKSPVPERKSRRERNIDLRSPSPPSKSPVPERKSRRERNIDLRSPSPPSKSPVPERKSRRERNIDLRSPSPPSKSPVPERKSRRERNIDLRSPSPPSKSPLSDRKSSKDENIGLQSSSPPNKAPVTDKKSKTEQDIDLQTTSPAKKSPEKLQKTKSLDKTNEAASCDKKPLIKTKSTLASRIKGFDQPQKPTKEDLCQTTIEETTTKFRKPSPPTIQPKPSAKTTTAEGAASPRTVKRNDTESRNTNGLNESSSSLRKLEEQEQMNEKPCEVNGSATEQEQALCAEDIFQNISQLSEISELVSDKGELKSLDQNNNETKEEDKDDSKTIGQNLRKTDHLGNANKTNMAPINKDKKGLFMKWEKQAASPELTRASTSQINRRFSSTSSPNRNLVAARRASFNKEAEQEKSTDSETSNPDTREQPAKKTLTRNSALRGSLNENTLFTTKKRLVSNPHSIASLKNGNVKNRMAIFAKFQKE